MKHNFLFAPIFVLLIFSCSNPQKNQQGTSQTQNKPSPSPKKSIVEIDSLSQIPLAYQNIVDFTQSTAVDSSSFTYNCHGEKSGKVIFYRKNNELVLVEKIFGEYSHTEGKEQYFILAGKPFFVFKTVTSWSFDSNSDVEGATIDKVTEKRFYIVKEKLAKCLQKQYEVHSTEKESFNANQIENTATNCATLKELLTDYEVLLNYKSQSTPIECL